MADVIGKVEGLEGKFFIKDPQGNLKELKNGDEVYEGETIIPDTNNAQTATLLVTPTDGTTPLKIDSTKEQILDKAFLNEGLNNQELAFNPESTQDPLILNNQNPQNEEPQTAQFTALDGTQTDVNSDLRKKEFDGDKKEPIQENNQKIEQTTTFTALDDTTTDINSDLRQRQFGGHNSDYTQEGEGIEKTSQFTALDGARTDVNSDLRQASWSGIADYKKIQNDDIVSNGIETDLTFTSRDGASTDIVSDLRKAEWFDTLEEPKYNGDIDNSSNYINSIPVAVDEEKLTIKESENIINGQLLINDIPGNDGLIKGQELKEFTYHSSTYTFDSTNTTYTIETTLGKLTIHKDGVWQLDNTELIIFEDTNDNFSYKIIDSNGDISNSAIQEITIQNINYTPTAVNEEPLTIIEGMENLIGGQLLANDIAGGDGLISTKELKEFTYDSTTYTFDTLNSTYTIDTTLGKLTVNQNGTWELDSTQTVSLQDTNDNFTYKIIDANGDISNSATQEILLKDINYTPTAIDDTQVIFKEGGSSITGQLLTNDIAGGDGLISTKELKEFTYDSTTYTFDTLNSTYTIDTTLGKLTVNQNGTWELDPTSITITEHTPDSFTYKIIDANGDISNSATQPFLMSDKDFITNIITTTPEDTNKVFYLNDIGGDIIIKDTSSLNQKTLTTNESINITRTNDTEIIGTVTNNGDGSVTFTPSPHYCGEDAEFSYEVVRSDNTTIVNDSVKITVTPTAEIKTNDTNSDLLHDVITQGDKTYAAIDESATYNYIPLTELTITNEDDRGNNTNPFASEITTVKLSEVPIGFKFLYNDGADHELTVTNLNDGVTIPFEYISTLQVKPTDFFAGEIKVKMEVITVDCEIGAPADQDTNISTPDYLIINVNNVANGIDALNAAQATGDEDAGRANGNTSNDSSPESITAPQNGIDLDITATTVDTSGREEVTTMIDKIPNGGAIYYSDANGTITVDASGVVSGTNPNVTVLDNGDTTWKITIADFDNNAPLKFIPPHNSNADYNFEATAFTKDGDSISSTTAPKTINVVVDGVADIPVHDDFKKLDSNEAVNADTNKNIYSDVVIEDNSNTRSGATISFENLYKEAGLASYDNDSETLSVVITNLGSSFSVQDATGISFNGKSGTAREWSFDVTDLDKVVITTSNNYSGDFSFKVKHITTEDDGDSKTFEKDVKILVKPLVEATVTTSSNATEDIASKINFDIQYHNSDTNETLDALWINKAAISGKNFTLYSDAGATTTLGANGTTIVDDGSFYKLTGAAIASVYIKYDLNVGSANTSDSSFGIKYTVSDAVTATNAETFTSTNEEASGVYNISLLSVTDSISVDTSNVSGTNVTYTEPSGVKTVTLNDLGTFTLDVDITGDSDTDGSEKATRLVIEGVQRGITVDGATMGISGDKNIWFLDIPDTDIDGDGATYTVTFNVNYSITPDTDSTIKITAYSKDSGSASNDIQLASTTIDFIDGMPDGGAGVPPADITASMSVNNTLITEDTSFTLADVLTVTADSVHDTDNNAIYSIAFRSLDKVSFDMDLTTHTINTYNDGGVNVYVVTATGSQASIDSMLNSVYLKPNQDYNTNNAAGINLTFNAVLTAYEATGYGRDTATVDFSSADNGTSVKPVTDDITSNVAKNNINEDGETSITITFDTVDDPDYTIVQAADDPSVAATVAITHKSGIYGTLTWSGGGTYTFDNSHTVADVPVADIGNGNLKFVPTQDASGNVTFTYTIFAKETGADNISETSKDFTISVSPVADGLNLPELKGIGDEDTYIQIYADFTNTTPIDGATEIDIDNSESVSSMFIDKVPEGFLLYIGDTHQTMATKGSQTGTVTIDGTTFDTYNWTINISGGIPKVWLKAPQNWSSTTNVDLRLDTLVKDGGSTTTVSKDFTVTIDSIVDGFSSVTENNTTQTASVDVAINLNANAIDLDGSETGILTLEGLGAGATFKQDGVDISGSVTYVGDTYTITDIDLSTDKLNKLTFQQEGLENQNINYAFKTIESDDSEISSVESGSFTATTDTIITNITTAGTVGVTDRLELSGGGIDFSSISSTSIEKIDLTQNGDTNITNVTLQEVIDATDGTNNLIIIADNANDTVALKNDGGNTWSQGSNINYGEQSFETYTNSGDPTVTLQISDEATVTIA